MRICLKLLLLVFINFLTLYKTKAQCNQNYNWVTWNSFTGLGATGAVNINSNTVGVTMTANYNFGSTPTIFNYNAFSTFNGGVPNTTVPRTNWSASSRGVTTMCFSQTVANPVLLFSSLGNPSTPVTLRFSLPYQVVFNGGGMTYVNDTTLIGREGYAVLLFPGNFRCVSIYSTTPEDYTNITWGVKPPLFPVSITGNPIACGRVVLTASGGTEYLWSGGSTPNAATNSFSTSGTYFLTVKDANGCTVTTSATVTVTPISRATIRAEICEGESYLGYTTGGDYNDTFHVANSCDSIRTLQLAVKRKVYSTVDRTICQGTSYLGYASSGTYKDTFTSVVACDSIRTLNLTVRPQLITNKAITICEGQNSQGYTQSGIYSDTIPSSTGCDSIVKTSVTLIKNCGAYFPSAFTPNSDGRNDSFKVLNAVGIEDYHLEIFNRWGQKVFETRKPENGWNGVYKGMQQEGVFIWQSQFRIANTTRLVKGTVVVVK